MSATKFVFLIFSSICFTLSRVTPKVFNLKDYGAVIGNIDNSQALLQAWNAACKWKGGAILVVSESYLIGPVILQGPCMGPIEFRNSGTLKAPLGLKGDYWIDFRYVDHLRIVGGGDFDGQRSNQKGGHGLPTLLRFGFVKNSLVQKVRLINSQTTHFHIFGCDQIIIREITISSPGDSPNTDGIKIGSSTGINIFDSTIASGDDCVALLRGSKNITVSGLVCGPGHGISIGSMGTTPDERVERVVVRHCTLSNTTNGLRIKTWASNLPGLVSNILYENITFNQVDNPIIIEQNYCPSRTCAKGNSKVQITNVRFRNIRGTSRTNIAVNLECSGSNPCQSIEMKDIDIKYVEKGESTIAKCSNARGQALGVQIPKSCIS